ncbi:MAG: isoleucine--tRNA ligase [Elusimicrobia bacterium]|jgi:isoleucyl-tRNA synthetase|nr:isoleucine--tRNA ligase [Elusimicrobiota bacterium]
MKANLSGKEPHIQKEWDKKEIFKKRLEKNKGKETFILHDGPPYANGHIHIGTALNRMLKDMVIKYKSMTGHYAPFVPGWDCHGLPVEYELLKKIDKKKINDKVKFRKEAAKYALNFVNIQRKEFKRLGLVGEWDNPYLTLNPKFEETIVKSFKELYLNGYIYRAQKPVYWCSSCKTALAEAEVEYKDIDSPSIYVKFPVHSAKPDFVGENTRLSALVWTTTPWTLPSNRAVCFHPDFKYAYIKKGDECLIVAESFAGSVDGDKFDGYKTIGTVKGSKLEGVKFSSPFRDEPSEGINADFVTLEDGTGIVHIAPGHGEDDYQAGLKYNLDIFSPVDDSGRFQDSAGVKEIEGKYVFESNPVIISLLKEEGLLFGKEDISHSYPHCWRCKNPIVYRATKQWFLDVDKSGLRARILEKIDEVKWYPESSIKRIKAMIQNRPDWCLSRQRLWGVPIPVFYCKDCGEIVATDKSLSRIADEFSKNGSDIWFEKSAKELLGDGIKCACGSSEFKKENDILDVWFDSGVSNLAVLENRPGLSWPADLYLEGSDQHRGWFQSSIIPSVAIKGTPPYRGVLTHGFIVDAEGKKMSKSVGNVVAPQEVIKKYGADLLRLWVASENYFKDIKISDEILAQMVTNYRRIRNTIRFILGNTGDYPAGEAVDYKELTGIDKYVLQKFYETAAVVKENYENLSFHKGMRAIHDFCNLTMSSLYFNILKDRLYVSRAFDPARRSSQYTLKMIGENLLKLLFPVLSHTTEEAWKKYIKEQDLSGEDYPGSIMLCDIKYLPEEWNNPDVRKEWDKIIKLRDIVLKEVEIAKEKEKIKDPLQTAVTLTTSSPVIFDFLNNHKDDWKENLIVSAVDIKKAKELSDGSDFLDGQVVVEVSPAQGNKCVRCWLVSKSVGKDSSHPELCGRCSSIVRKINKSK